MLFNKRLLQTHLNNFDYPSDLNYERVQKTISLWQESIKNGNYEKTKEIQVQSAFLTKFFNNILGYVEKHESPDEWQLDNEVKTEIDKTRADGALGYFTKEHNNDITRAVIELKDANTPLDKKQSSRKDYDSPVSQAFSYSSKFDRCDWIIVSNFKEIRLYNKERGQGYYESFEVLNLNDEKEFKRFYFCLCKQNLLDKNRNSLLDNLVKDTSKNEEEISKDFYKDFKALRKSLFEHICENNLNIDKKCLLEKTQKLLDRLVFVMFCEDSTIGLLPPFTLKNYCETGKNLPIPSDTKIWDIIKGLFQSIDKGNSDINPPINKYNGGLFAPDEILDNLKIKDSAWSDVIKLAGYDFESDLNVNILGHIFEQSLNDLEQIKAEIDGIEQDNKKSKRKKDGIFYTPEYITRYIVEQTIGKYLEENPDKLETIKILDPACGSGAFLNQAHSFLQQQYKIRTEERINATRLNNRAKGQEVTALNLFEHSNIADTNRSILLNNLYGVDLNSESTEITKLALWLKTAQKDQPLQNLDKNIKCGNSLIDDETIAGDKAFNWNEEFKDTMASGGFDVIIGNPPYGAELDEQAKNYIYRNYNSVEYQIDTYVVFIERALKLLKEGGKLSFIVPSTWLNMHYFSKLRNLIISGTKLEQVILYRYQVFDDVTAETCIFVCSKTNNKDNKVRISYINNLEKNNNIEFDNILQDYWKDNCENGFNVFYNQEKINIINLVYGKSKVLDDIASITVGIKPYQTNKGTPKQTKQDVENRVYDSDTQVDDLYQPYIVGTNINKYHITKPIGKYLKYGDWLAEPRKSLNFKTEKIVIRQTSDKIIAAIDYNGYYDLNNVHNLLLKNNNINLKYLLTLLNSKIVDFAYKFLVPEAGRVFAEVKAVNLAKLPIANATQEQQQNLAQKADKMIELNKQLHEGINSALELIKSEYQPKKISQNLEKFYTLGIHPFLEELEKQKVKLSLNQKEELIIWYKEKSEQLNKIKQQIDTLDKQIDQEVYKLYNLTDEEIKIIEES